MTKEHNLEQKLIDKLCELKYVYRQDIHDRAALEQNFREKFEALNRVHLTDSEFQRLLDEIITDDVFKAATTLRGTNTIIRDDGTPLNYTLVNIKDWCKNSFEVVNQLRINTDNSHHRYDVILLINGVPVVQIELKTLGKSPNRAVEQIVNYKKDPGNGYTRTLLCFMQLFIVSNWDTTYYFANNNNKHFKFDAEGGFPSIYRFAAENNVPINGLDEFADKFLAKCTLSEMISRYMVLVATEKLLMVMRPYQIYAVKAIVERIRLNCGNGYIWHTTGSGKTLTSFKASTLLKDNPDIEKCVFVVDRKDLDRQTRDEFNKFQENCVEENTNTFSLVRRLLSEDFANKVIVCTIQKLGRALGAENNNKKKDQNKSVSEREQKREETAAKYRELLKPLRDKRIIFIFDECHRSQSESKHEAIKNFFPNAQLFGFTGTPIFDKNASRQQIEGQQASNRTTKDIFQEQLHAYTITEAIEDKNVLRFHVDYYKPDDEEALQPGQTFSKRSIVEAILSKHNAATSERRFNALFATGSISEAIEYFSIFKKVQAEKQKSDPDFIPLNIACVFSPPPDSKEARQIQEDLPQEKADYAHEPDKKKEALEAIIADYNERFETNKSISEFDSYYKDVQDRIKNHKIPNGDMKKKGKEKIDITIVVDMLLTGFDSKFLNTLYVDKNLKYHGLIQAFSRTNRTLDSTKPYGNILDFRQQQKEVDEAVTLFSGKEADKAREIWLVDEAPVVINKLKGALQELDNFMKSQGLRSRPEDVPNLRGDDARAQFIKCFKEVQRCKTQLDQYTDLSDDQKQIIEEILPTDDLRSFHGVYIETAHRLKEQRQKPGQTVSAEVDQLDFEFVLFASTIIDYDYIMNLISRFTDQDPKKAKMSREQLIGLIRSDAKFMDERETITDYVNSLKSDTKLDENAVREGYEHFKDERYAAEIASVSSLHGLTNEALQGFVDGILDRMIFDGEKLTDLMEPLELSWHDRREKELALMEELVPILKKRAAGRDISGLNAYEQ